MTCTHPEKGLRVELKDGAVLSMCADCAGEQVTFRATETARVSRETKSAEPLPADTPEYRQAYRRGWKAGNSSAYGSLDNALSRGEPAAWIDGYMDKAVGREMWHALYHGDERCGR